MNSLSESAAPVAAQPSRDLVAAQAEELYSRAPIGFAASVVNALILAGVMRGHVDVATRWSWFVVICVVTLLRYRGLRNYRAGKAAPPFEPERAVSGFTFGIGVSGLVWGASAVFLFPDSVAHQAFLAFVIGGMVAGATATFSVRMDTFLAFTIPALLPLVFRLASVGDELHVAMGAMVLLFGALLWFTAYRVHTAVTRWLTLQEEMRVVRGDLIERAEEAESLSSELDRTRGLLDDRDQENNEQLRRYLDDMADRFDTLRSSDDRRLRMELRAHHKARRTTSLTTFSQGVAHELTGALETLSKTLSLAWRQPDRLPPASAITHMFVQTEAAAQNMHRLAKRLALYASEDESTLESVDLSAVAQATVDAWRVETSYRGQLRGSFPAVAALEGDGDQLAFALRQLLDNASEAVRPDRAAIEVRVETVPARSIDRANAQLHVTSSAREFVALTVQDNGIGMAEEIVDRMFDPFFTTKVSTDGIGRGFGLAAVAATVTRHGGEITVSSRSLMGSTIRIFLPVEA